MAAAAGRGSGETSSVFMSGGLLELVRLNSLMALTSGREEITVALLDGPVTTTHPQFAGSKIRSLPSSSSQGCKDLSSVECRHGTFVAGLLAGARGSVTSGISPGCTLLVRPIYSETREGDRLVGTTPERLAGAIVECMDAGARVVNVSSAIPSSAITAEEELHDVLGDASRRGVVVVAAAGNEASVGQSAITGHPWVLAVVAFGRDRRPMAQANLGRSIGRYGVGAPGENVTSLDPAGGTATMSGSSFAAPFVAGAAALLWSLVPTATAQEIRGALTDTEGHRRRTVTPPLLDAWAAYEALVRHHGRRKKHGENGQSGPSAGHVTTTCGAPAPIRQR